MDGAVLGPLGGEESTRPAENEVINTRNAQILDDTILVIVPLAGMSVLVTREEAEVVKTQGVHEMMK